MAKKKGYSWLSNYVTKANDTRKFLEAANGVAVVCIFLGGRRLFSDVLLFYCEGVVLGWRLGWLVWAYYW